MAYDVVCNAEVDEGTTMWSSEHRGRTYHFCAQVCKALFDSDPEMWAD
jgi:YHS domain-containing protein